MSLPTHRPDRRSSRGRAGTVLGVRRDLDWDGCCNVRDLGGLPLDDGGSTRWGAIVRSDNPARLSAAGWRAVRSYGIRTVITLRTLGTTDPDPDPNAVPEGITVTRVDLEDATDPEFRRRCVDNGLWATPLEWVEMLRFWPHRCAGAVRAVAHAKAGGVVVSCGIGRDRTGLATFLLLAIAGVPCDVIAEDWLHSHTRLADDPVAAGLSSLDVLERHGWSVIDAIEAALAENVASRLIEGGLRRSEIDAVRDRLIR